jgi:LysM repeat protein
LRHPSHSYYLCPAIFAAIHCYSIPVPVISKMKDRLIKKLLIFCCMFIAGGTGLAQDFPALPGTVLPAVTDSLVQKAGPGSDSVSIFSDSIAIDGTSGNEEMRCLSVYDIFWNTASLKCGWKRGDTLMIGTGLEPCDTVHQFIMPVTGKLWRGCTYYHSGWDIGLNTGDPVVAGLSGKVRFAKYCHGYGNLVIVRHCSGMEVYYAHLSKFMVSTNQYVEAGDTIGLGGATGRTRGSHLHMEFRVCDQAIDIADLYTQNDTVVNLYKIKKIVAAQNLPPEVVVYTVVKGDNLSSIARRYGTSVKNLCSLNHISSNSILRIGQKLRVH